MHVALLTFAHFWSGLQGPRKRLGLTNPHTWFADSADFFIHFHVLRRIRVQPPRNSFVPRDRDVRFERATTLLPTASSFSNHREVTQGI